jgi:hypothetical protein
LPRVWSSTNTAQLRSPNIRALVIVHPFSLQASSTIVSACRDATRAAIPATAQSGDAVAAATRTLAQANIPLSSTTILIQDTATGWSTVTDVSAVPAGHNLEVTPTATYVNLPHVYRPFNDLTGHGIPNNKVIQSICMMTKE